MKQQRATLWPEVKKTAQEAYEETIHAFWKTDAWNYDVWDIAYSGGKDSTATVTALAHAFEKGDLPRPKRIRVFYGDTGMELPPLHQSALQVLKHLETFGFETHSVRPELCERFFVYMFGRGIPLPNNGRMRWCTRVLKIKPMALQMKTDTTTLLITGVREGESAIRDEHITAACSKDGGECGQGYLYVKSVEKGYATIAPILGWRVCHVYDWLTLEAPCDGFDTSLIAEVYGYDSEDGQEEPLSARTGCINCPLVTSPQDKPKPDKMVERVLALPHYQYLAPLRKLLDLYVELTDDRYHLQKDGTQRLKNGGIPKNLYRKGPLTMEARRYGLATVKAIQDEVNRAARACQMPEVSLISAEEEACILDLIAANTWPQAWSGTEPLASEFTPPDEHTALAQQLELLLEGQRG